MSDRTDSNCGPPELSNLPRQVQTSLQYDGEDIVMKTKRTAALILIAGTLLAPFAMAEDMDADRSQPKAFVKDSIITTKIKSKLAAQHITSLSRIKVDTDKNGVVWLSGTAPSAAYVEKATQIARDTDGVRDVNSTVSVKLDE